MNATLPPDPPHRPSVTAPRRGRFITFEGGEGAGKTTQIRRLADVLGYNGINVTVTREPGGSPKAEAIRHVLLSGAAEPLGVAAEAVLFAAARADHVSVTIRPALDGGGWVLCDRFSDSTRVYQGLAGLDPALLNALERVAVDDCQPDLTIILDIPAEAGLRRATLRRGASADADRFEREDLSVHEARRQAFLALAAGHPGRYAVIDADRDAEIIADDIRQTVATRLGVPLQPRLGA